jgi:hypothetical protein
MPLLDLVQKIAVKVGIPSPTVAVSSNDANVQAILGFVNEAGQELAARYAWQELVKEATFTTVGVQGGISSLSGFTGGSGYAGGSSFSNIYQIVPLTGGHGSGATATISVINGVVTAVSLTLINGAGSGYQAGDVLSASNASLGGTGSGFTTTVAAVGLTPQQNQGAIQSITGPDFAFILNETMWDRTTRRPVFGPKAPAEWQQLQAQLLQGPWWQYRIRGNQLLMLPAPSVGDQIYFEWVSNYWCTSSGSSVPTQNTFAADTDVGILDERLLRLDALWRYKADKKLAYAEDFDKAEEAIADAMARNASKPRLNLNGAAGDILPGMFVPAGSWSGTYGFQ